MQNSSSSTKTNLEPEIWNCYMSNSENQRYHPLYLSDISDNKPLNSNNLVSNIDMYNSFGCENINVNYNSNSDRFNQQYPSYMLTSNLLLTDGSDNKQTYYNSGQISDGQSVTKTYDSSTLNKENKPIKSDFFLNNLVDNWMSNPSGTYTPFGDTTSKHSSSKFEETVDKISEATLINKKPEKMSYSDVLTKPVNKTTSKGKENVVNNISKKVVIDKSNNGHSEGYTTDSRSTFNTNKVKSEINSVKNLSFKPEYTPQSDKVKIRQVNKTNSSSSLQKAPDIQEKINIKEPAVEAEEDDSTTRKPNTSANEKVKTSARRIPKHVKVATKQSEKINNKKTNKLRKNKKCISKVHGYINSWIAIAKKVVKWFITLVLDVSIMSYGLFSDLFYHVIRTSREKIQYFQEEINFAFVEKFFIWVDNKFVENSKYAVWRKFRFYNLRDTNGNDTSISNLPKTREEAMHHLLNCKGKDPYSVICLESSCTDNQIRKHYKRLAMLVHPDKNSLPGAEEAFKILHKAFELIGEPETRKAYHLDLARALNTELALNEFEVLLTELQEKINQASNTIRCTNCNKRHVRIPTGRPCYAARMCTQCKIRHSAKEGDIWAETHFLGLRWTYLACMDGAIYDITQWAGCQKSSLGHLTPNSHHVQYRIVLGDKNGTPKPPKSSTNNNTTSPNISFEDFISNLCTSSFNTPMSPPANETRRRNQRQN